MQAKEGMNQNPDFFRVWILWHNGRAILAGQLKSMRVPQTTRGNRTAKSTQCVWWWARYGCSFCSPAGLTLHLLPWVLPLLASGTFHASPSLPISMLPSSPWKCSHISQPLLTMHETEYSCIPWTYLETDLGGYQLINTVLVNRHTASRHQEPLVLTC